MARALDNYYALVRDIRQGNWQSVYLFYGHEQVLARHVVTILQEQLLPAGMETLNMTRLDGQKHMGAEIVVAIETPPMFGAQRLVVIDAPDFSAMPKTDSEQLLDLLSEWPDYTCAVFLARKIDKRLRLVKHLLQQGAAYEFPALTAGEAARWVEEQLRRARLRTPRGTGRFVVERCGTDLSLLRLEVDKLIDFAGEQPLTQADLQQIVRQDVETSIFDLVDAIGLQDLGRAWGLLLNMLQEGKEPVYLLSMIARQLRLLLVARLALDAGLSQQQAARKLGIHPFPAGKCVQQAQRWSVAQLRQALDSCLQADECIKTGELRGESALNMMLMELVS